MSVQYLEIVSNEADTVIGLYESVHGLTFGEPDPSLGQARVATRADGTVVGVREPLAEHEQPVVRAYVAVEDIERAAKKAADHGAIVAFAPTRLGNWGTFAILIQGSTEHGLWQR